MFYRKFNVLFQDVILVGAGGTGSRVVAPLIQTLKQARAKLEPRLYIVDGDIFEHKNLARQNCIEKDLGRNKAIVMAERYGAALDFPVIAHPHMISAEDNLMSDIRRSAEIQSMPPPRSTRKIWILCVDSIDARLSILTHIDVNDVIIDAGNEDTFGQVSIFDKISLPHTHRRSEIASNIQPISGEYELPFIPAPLNQYLNALVNPSPATGSCADLDQSLAINNLMAAGIISLVQNLAYNNKFYCRTNYFDLLRGNHSERMTTQWFNEVWNETELPNPRITAYSHNYLHWSTYYQHHDLETGCELYSALMRDMKSKVNFVDPAILAAIHG